MTDKTDNTLTPTLNIESTLGLNDINNGKYKYNLVSLFNEYNSYFTNSINREINAYTVFLSLFSIFNLLSHISFIIFSNLSLFFLGMYSVIYNNINEKLGIKMTAYLGGIYLSGAIRQFIWSNSFFWYFNILILPISAGLFIMGNKRYESKSYRDLIKSMRYELLLIAPLHSFVYLEDKYKLTRCSEKMYHFLVNYVKKYSTSDVISDELKDRGVDDIDENNEDKDSEIDNDNLKKKDE
tara:strand:+ start:171 stop:887 length:717 start_codon:yes stop_codon:yes gene_type:complete